VSFNAGDGLDSSTMLVMSYDAVAVAAMPCMAKPAIFTTTAGARFLNKKISDGVNRASQILSFPTHRRY
jgi:hypothetical protein